MNKVKLLVVVLILLVNTFSQATIKRLENLSIEERRGLFTQMTVILTTDGSKRDRIEAIKQIEQFMYAEAGIVLFRHFFTYIQANGANSDVEYLSQILSSLKFAGSSVLAPSLIEMIKQIEITFREVDPSSADQLQFLAIDLVNKVGLKNIQYGNLFEDDPFVDQKALPAPGDDSFVTVEGINNNASPIYEYIEQIENYLNENLIGQPEVTNALINSIVKDNVISDRTNPEIFYLLGGPGTGKDTAAELVTNAIHGGEDDAHEDHLMSIDQMSTGEELWRLIGSPTGFKGADQVPALLKFAIMHSGGRYYILEEENMLGTIEYTIMENEEWTPESAEGYTEKDAVVFLNEYHNWSKEAKDGLKTFLERGYLTINNPKGNASRLVFKPRVMIASNEGIEELSSRDRFGARQGEALTPEQMNKKWDIFSKDIDKIKKSILKTNMRGGANNKNTAGISEETLNRIPIFNFLVLRPHTPEGLQKIVNLRLKRVAKSLSQSGLMMGEVELSWTKKLTQFVQEYDFNPEENARPMKDKIDSLIVGTLIEGIRSKKLPASMDSSTWNLNVTKKKDSTWNLNVRYYLLGEDREKSVSLPIKITEKDRPVAPVSQEQLNEWGKVKDLLSERVRGIDHIIERLSREVVEAMEIAYLNKRKKNSKERATVFGFFGLSSTGKTETAKVLTKAMFGSKDQLVTISFNNIASRQDMKEFLLGVKHPDGSADESPIQAALKRYSNEVVINLDEIVNVQDPNALKMLYDFFDEPTVTFANGEEISMGGVTFILTGNIGDKIYKSIPLGHLSKEAKRHFYTQAYEIFMANETARKNLLFDSLNDPLVKRIGLKRIFFFGPLDYEDSTAIAQMSLLGSIKKLSETEGRRFWEVLFNSTEDFKDVVFALDEKGFSVEEQGRSLREMIDEQFYVSFRSLMQEKGIPSGSKVWLSLDSKAPETMLVGSTNYHLIQLNLHVEGRRAPIKLRLQGSEVTSVIYPSREDRVLTAFHEAGHEIVRRTYLSNYTQSNLISIRPGLAEIDGKLTFYEGVAQRDIKKISASTREKVVRDMAGLSGGYMAEKIVSKGGRHGMGKNNDIERATKLAYEAIILGGLSPEWGTETLPQGVKLEEFIQRLPEGRRELLNELVKEMLLEAEFLALKALRANFETALIPLGVELAKKGEINERGFKAFYKGRRFLKESSDAFDDVEFKESDRQLFEAQDDQKPKKKKSMFDKLQEKTSKQSKGLEVEFVDEVPSKLNPVSSAVLEKRYKRSRLKKFVLDVDSIPVKTRKKARKASAKCIDLLTD